MKDTTLRNALNLLLILNGVDAILTTVWVHTGLGTEANPLLENLVFTPLLFIATKILLVSLGCYIIWKRHTHRLAITGVVVCVACYTAVCVYHLTFLASIVWP